MVIWVNIVLLLVGGDAYYNDSIIINILSLFFFNYIQALYLCICL